MNSLTLHGALEDQKDLGYLSSPKTVNRFEVFPENDHYGFAYHMKRYAGYPVKKPIYATFPHGIYLRDEVIGKRELLSKFKTHLCFPPHVVDVWKKIVKNKEVVPFAAPIHYVLKNFRCEVACGERKGTLFVPIHSTQAFEIDIDNVAAIAELNQLPSEYHPITMCVSQNDFLLGQHKHYQEAGFEIVCAGHFTDTDFILRWLHLASQFKLIAGAGLGSSLFYAVLLGIPYFLIEQDVTSKIKPHINQNRIFNKTLGGYSKKALIRREEIRRLFSEPIAKATAEQIDLVEYYTQAELVKTPDQLREFFLQLETQEQ